MFRALSRFSQTSSVQMAIAMALGVATAATVFTLVDAVLMPFVSGVTGMSPFQELKIALGQDAMLYGKFVISFLHWLVVLVVFLLILAVVYKKEAGHVRECPFCLMMIPRNASFCQGCGKESPVPDATNSETDAGKRPAR